MKYVFDLCGTISPLNNTWDFIRFVYSKKKMNHVFLFKRIITKILSKTNKNPYVSRYKRVKIFFKGMSENELAHYSREYYDHIFKRTIYPKLLKEIQTKNKEDIYLSTAAPSYPANIIGERLGFEKEKIFSAKLEFKNNICTGCFVSDNYIKYKKYPDEIFTFFTDMIKEDISLIKESKVSYLITNGEMEQIK